MQQTYDELKKIKIRQIEVYRPEYFKKIDEIIEEFKLMGKDIEFLAKEFLGKNIIHLSKDNAENSLTMAIEVTKKVLMSTGLKGNEFDMIVVSTTTPEYSAPTMALLLHNEIKGKSDAICYDINANCIGSVLALNQIYSQMTTNDKINRVLLVGCDYVTIHLEKDNESVIPNFGDAACAIVIERATEECGLIDSKSYIETTMIDNVVFPQCGSSHIYDVDKDLMRMKAESVPKDISQVVNKIDEMLVKNKLTVDDISLFCFSQSAQYFIEYLKDRLNIADEKAIYIGDQYGYTATSSPFIALYEGIKQNKIKRGDYILFWTVAVGEQHIFSLIRY